MKREFYLQNSCAYLGNSMLWRAKQGGYTTDLVQARVFPLDEAQAQHNAHHTDIPWPTDYIHPASRLVVDRQDVRSSRIPASGVQLHLEPAQHHDAGACHHCGTPMTEAQRLVCSCEHCKGMAACF